MTKDDMKMTERADLLALLYANGKDRDAFGITFSHEVFLFKKNSLAPLTLNEPNGILAIFHHFIDAYDYSPITKHGKLLGVQDSKGNRVLYRRAAQLEFSSAHLISPNTLTVFFNMYQQQLIAFGNKVGYDVFNVGYQPFLPSTDVPVDHDERSTLFRGYVGSKRYIDDIFQSTASATVRLDFDNEQTMVRMFRVSLALLPLLKALFCNSPFKEKRQIGYKSYNSYLWSLVNSDREKIFSMVFEPGFSFERYLDYVLRMPMAYVVRDGAVYDAENKTFEDFLLGNLPFLDGTYPTARDFYRCLSFVLSEVRICHGGLEIRSIDSCHRTLMVAFPTFVSSLLYMPVALDKVEHYLRDWETQEILTMLRDVPTLGLDTPFRDRTLRDVGLDILPIAKESARKQVYNGEIFLTPIEEMLTAGRTPADHWIALYLKHEGDFSKLMEDISGDEHRYFLL